MCEKSVCVLQKKKTDEEAQIIHHDSALYLVRIASFSIYHVYRSCVINLT